MKRIVAGMLCAVALLVGLWACGGTSPTPAPAPVTVTTITLMGVGPAVGTSTQFTATAVLSNGSTLNVTSQATWQSSNPAAISVSSTGLVTSVTLGEADVRASYQNVTGSTHVVAAPPAVRSVSVVGAVPPVGGSAQFTANATLSDGSTANVTSQATWQSSNGGVVVVSLAGVVMSIAGGEADVRATYQSVTGSAHVTVTPVPASGSNICALGAPISASCGTASVLCSDGTYTCSQTRSGACSSHGVVSCFFCPGPLCQG